MINFHAPTGPARTMAVSFGAFLGGGYAGPFPVESYTDKVAFRDPNDSLSESPGIFGENHVKHRQTHGDLYWNPWLFLKKTKTTVKGVMKNPDGSQIGSSVNLQLQQFAPTGWVKLPNKYGEYSCQMHDSFAKVTLGNLSISRPSLAYPNGRTRFTPSMIHGYVSSIEHPSLKGYSEITSESYRGELVTLMSYDPSEEAIIDLVIQSFNDMLQTEPITSPQILSAKCYHLDPINPTGYETPGMIYRALAQVKDLKVNYPIVKSFGELSQEAVETLDSNNINMFEFAQGFKDPKQMLLKLRNLSKLSTHSDNYLAVQYGILPTISDLQTLKDVVLAADAKYEDGLGHQVLTSGHTVSRSDKTSTLTVTRRCKIAIDDSAPVLKGMAERLRNIGAFPDAASLWDLVPYSFVIDWFVNVGDILADMDTNVRMASLPIVYCTTSEKVYIDYILPKSLSDAGIDGQLTTKHYHRSVSIKAPRPTLNFEASNGLPNHWLEAGALIVSGSKKN